MTVLQDRVFAAQEAAIERMQTDNLFSLSVRNDLVKQVYQTDVDFVFDFFSRRTSKAETAIVRSPNFTELFDTICGSYAQQGDKLHTINQDSVLLLGSDGFSDIFFFCLTDIEEQPVCFPMWTGHSSQIKTQVGFDSLSSYLGWLEKVLL